MLDTKMTDSFEIQISDLEVNPSTILKHDIEQIYLFFEMLDNNYHNKGTPLLSDTMYDKLTDIVTAKYPDFKKDIIGSQVDKRKVKLPYWMGSMDKLNHLQIKKFTEQYPGKYVISNKLDGISALLVFESSQKVKMYTRGDGNHGQDISNIINHIGKFKNPTKYNWKDGKIAIRGELIIKKSAFEKMQGSNARNVVAGIVNKKVIDPIMLKNVDFVAYALIEPQLEVDQHETFVKKYFPNMNYVQNKIHENINPEYLKSILLTELKNSIYEIDGIIVSQNSIHKPIVNKNPKYAFAFKDNSLLLDKETTVIGVEWNISKDGYIKPTILVEPIDLSGAIIKRTSGFNADYIVKNKIVPGTKLHIKRSGDVIPYIVKVINNAAVEDSSGDSIISATLSSDIIWEWNDTRKDIFSTNNTNEIQFKSLCYFYKVIKIHSLSDGNLRKLYDNGYVKPIDVFNITLLELEKIIGNKMAVKIIGARDIAFEKVKFQDIMIASNLFGRSIGEKKIELICQSVNCLDIINKSSQTFEIKDLLSVSGISDKTGAAFLNGVESFKAFILENPFPLFKTIQSDNNKSIGIDIKNNGVNAKINDNTNNNVANIITSEKLKGVVILFTGVRDKELEKSIIENGGIVSTTFNKNVNTLLVKDADTNNTKVAKAIEKNLKIFTLEEIKTLL